MSDYHIPVLLDTCIDGLKIKADGIYVDVTFGGGGHSREILKKLSKKGKLIVFDQDEDARNNIINDDRLEFVKSNFRYLKRQLKYLGIEKVDGILADLGVSSYQFDEGDKGFSYRNSVKLDMRMNQEQKKTAATILNTYKEDRLAKVFWQYGEVKNSRKLARFVAEERERNQFDTVQHFLDFLQRLVQGKKEKYWSKVFQALRIEVNDEIGALEDLLLDLPGVLNTGARVVVMSYHSLEDRLVKRFFKSGNLKGIVERDIYGNTNTRFKLINKKIIVPTESEVVLNVRARSAKLRIAEFLT